MIEWTDEALLERMRRGWDGGLPEGTPCGTGSLMERAAAISRVLPDLVERYAIKLVSDAGAGDKHWIQHVAWKVKYRAFDLLPRADGVECLDITKDALPPCDMILCRMVLVHLDPPRVLQALELFRQSATYLLATTHLSKNRFDPTQQFNKWDLSASPFNLGEPLERIKDANHDDCALALWRLKEAG